MASDSRAHNGGQNRIHDSIPKTNRNKRCSKKQRAAELMQPAAKKFESYFVRGTPKGKAGKCTHQHPH